MEATAPECPRAKARRSWLASSAAPRRFRSWATALSSNGITVAIAADDTRAWVNFLFRCARLTASARHKRRAAAPFGTAAPKLKREGSYLRLFDTLLNVEFSLLPTLVIAPMAATAIRAAIRPYSMAVAPFSFLMSFRNLIMVHTPCHARSKRHRLQFIRRPAGLAPNSV